MIVEDEGWQTTITTTTPKLSQTRGDAERYCEALDE
jgi:hypothetical protein